MSKPQYPIHIHDDWISAELPDLATVHAFQDQLLEKGKWTEVVGGLKSIAVQFDPTILSIDEAVEELGQQLAFPPSESPNPASSKEIPICYDLAFALDIELIAEKLGLPANSIGEWHSAQDFKVTMLGFMPGFAYLQCAEKVPEIGRLPQPRKSVPAGSVGLIGDQSCIYSFDSPGGWPMIGRTPMKLFNPQNDPAALLTAGQKVQFVPVTIPEFKALL